MRASDTEQTSEQPRGLFGGIGLMAALNFGDTTCAAREA
jgi:hypothetical protein